MGVVTAAAVAAVFLRHAQLSHVASNNNNNNISLA